MNGGFVSRSEGRISSALNSRMGGECNSDR